jgi:hypothetical protein
MVLFRCASLSVLIKLATDMIDRNRLFNAGEVAYFKYVARIRLPELIEQVLTVDDKTASLQKNFFNRINVITYYYWRS